jgi:hypothetical protein
MLKIDLIETKKKKKKKPKQTKVSLKGQLLVI